MKNEHKYFIKSEILKMGSKYDTRQVFEDFVMCCSYAISNSCNYRDDIENSYLAIAKKYSKEEMNKFAEMLCHLQLEYMQEDSIDILGSIYEEIGMSNKYKGQFFTPEHICDLMTKLTISPDDAKKQIKEKGYFSISDPACGSGRLLFKAVDYLFDNDVDINKIYVEGADVSSFCCAMTYVNLSLKGISGIVKNQNTLTNDLYDTFYTPAFVLNFDLRNAIKKDNEGDEVEIE